MQALAGPFDIAAVLLIVGGAPKLLDPAHASRAMGSVGLPSNDLAGRSLGAGEVGIGLFALVAGTALSAGLVAMAYTGFVVFLVVAWRRNVATSCGCFGAADTPPSVGHVFVNAGAAIVAVASVVSPPSGLITQVSGRSLDGLVFLCIVALGSWLGYLALSVLPTVMPKEVDA